MALFLKNTVIYHPGRTGGHWLRANLFALGLVEGESNGLHDSPRDLMGCEPRAVQPQVVCIIRHPLTWIRSLWVHETQFGWTNADLAPKDEFVSFEDYLDQMIARYPGGICSHYFQPFVEASTHVGKYESLPGDSARILAECGFDVPQQWPYEGAINVSTRDGVYRAAQASPATLERYMQTEAAYCDRHGYERALPAGRPDGKDAVGAPWFLVLQAAKSPVAPSPPSLTTNTFRFSDGTVWLGAGHYRRTQLAFMEALSRRASEGFGEFCELGAGDGYYIFMAEQLGAASPLGVSLAESANAAAASRYLGSAARFEAGNPGCYATRRQFDTLLVRDQLNHTPWPHLLLLSAARLLKKGGQLILGGLVFRHRNDAPITLMAADDLRTLLPKTCPFLMSESYVRHLFAQCGLRVDEETCRYEEPAYGALAAALIRSGAAQPGIESLVRIVWRLSVADRSEFRDETAFWQHGNPMTLVDFVPEPQQLTAFKTIQAMSEEAKAMREQIAALNAAVHDRDVDLLRERSEFELRNSELIDRTQRLELALAELENLEKRAGRADSGSGQVPEQNSPGENPAT